MPRKESKALDHNTCRGMVCIICGNKAIPISSVRVINANNYTGLIQKHFIQNYDPSDQYKMNGLCNGCRNKLSEKEKFLNLTEEEKAKIKKKEPELPDPIDFSLLEFPVITRSTGVTDIGSLKSCNCDICRIARSNPSKVGNPYGGFYNGMFPNRERIVVQKPVTVCPTCWQVIGKGIPHPQPCSKSRRSTNESKRLDSDKNAKEKIASATIKEKQAEAPKNASSISLATGGNKQLQIPSPSVSSVKKCLFPPGEKQITAPEVQKMMVSGHMTLDQVVNYMKFQRNFSGRDLFEPGIESKLRELDKALIKFDSVRQVKMDSHNADERKRGQVNRDIAFTHDLRGLIKYLITARGYNPRSRLFIRFGCDGGGDLQKNEGSLKLTMQIEKIEDELSSPPKSKQKWSYAEGVSADRFKDSGILRLMLIGIVECVSESVHNLKTIVDLVDLERVKAELESEGFEVSYAFDQ